jgi:hypothetical protein
MTIESITAASAAAQDVQRTTAVLAKVLRTQREQAEATVALIQEASAQGAPPGSTGRIIDVRA